MAKHKKKLVKEDKPQRGLAKEFPIKNAMTDKAKKAARLEVGLNQEKQPEMICSLQMVIT